jgi:hypothetical protein
MGNAARFVAAVAVAGCAHHGTYLVGECDPPSDGTPVVTMESNVGLFGCPDSGTGLDVVDSLAQWNALLACNGNPAPQPTVDFTTSRAAIAIDGCSRLSLRFVSETPAEVVVGVEVGLGGGACVSEPLVVPLAKSTKPVRLAQCVEQCDDCPPVP